MKKSKPYSALPVNRVSLEVLMRGRVGQDVVVGFDIGKFEILTVPRWGNNDFNRPWRVSNPEQIPDLVRLLVQLGHGRRLRVALEPSGTYGDPLRQACHDAGLSVWRVSPKAAHDYAEIFDGTAVAARRQRRWCGGRAGGFGQGDGVAVYGQARGAAAWPTGSIGWARSGNCWCCGRVAWRGLLGAVLAGSNAGAEGDQGDAAACPDPLRRTGGFGGGWASGTSGWARWGGSRLSRGQAAALFAPGARKAASASARGRWSSSGYGNMATEALKARQQRCAAVKAASWPGWCKASRCCSCSAGSGQRHGVCVVGQLLATRARMSAGAAYRKAMGLNLTEYSSGTEAGRAVHQQAGRQSANAALAVPLAAFAAVQAGGRSRVVSGEEATRWARKRSVRWSGVMREAGAGVGTR